jgi:hemerythrin-like domain-containing protein
MSILELMLDHHRQCDDSFTKLENLVAENKWSDPGALETFQSMMTRHFRAEEDILFAALEEKMGGPVGPALVMRQEHQQMSALLEQMNEAFAARDRGKFLSLSDTWMMLTQQHNMKEEQVLYPMMDEVLAKEAPALISQARDVLHQP